MAASTLQMPMMMAFYIETDDEWISTV